MDHSLMMESTYEFEVMFQVHSERLLKSWHSRGQKKLAFAFISMFHLSTWPVFFWLSNLLTKCHWKKTKPTIFNSSRFVPRIRDQQIISEDILKEEIQEKVKEKIGIKVWHFISQRPTTCAISFNEKFLLMWASVHVGVLLGVLKFIAVRIYGYRCQHTYRKSFLTFF